MKTLLLVGAAIAMLGCTKKEEVTVNHVPEDAAPSTENASSEPLSLDAILAMQDEDSKLRYSQRHPNETLSFFGIQPGMTVIEALPGGGWYTKIISPYLGREGRLIGVDYDVSMWPNFSFATEEFIQKRKVWPQEWPKKAQQWSGDSGAIVSAYTLATLPAALDASVDAVLYIRALHNLSRFEDKGQYFSNALKESMRVLKPGGIVGVVQHRADEAKSDEWADGSRGYLKESSLIKSFEDLGFEFVSSSEVNANPKDLPGDDDIVWRLPPNYSTAKAAGEDESKVKAEMDAIGESDRMTLLFKKPNI